MARDNWGALLLGWKATTTESTVRLHRILWRLCGVVRRRNLCSGGRRRGKHGMQNSTGLSCHWLGPYERPLSPKVQSRPMTGWLHERRRQRIELRRNHIAAMALSRAYPFGTRKLVTQHPDCNVLYGRNDTQDTHTSHPQAGWGNFATRQPAHDTCNGCDSDVIQQVEALRSRGSDDSLVESEATSTERRSGSLCGR